MELSPIHVLLVMDLFMSLGILFVLLKTAYNLVTLTINHAGFIKIGAHPTSSPLPPLSSSITLVR